VFEPEEQIEALDAASCARLLASTQFGRLAVVADGRPRIIVLNHAVIGSDVVFRTAPGAFLVGATEGGAALDAVYEVDSAFPVGRSGWSVIAAGQLVRDRDEARIAAARARVAPWANGDRDVVLRLDVAELTGRRVGPL